eukprot:12926949-Prorocentrum_lima.AAC.1
MEATIGSELPANFSMTHFWHAEQFDSLNESWRQLQQPLICYEHVRPIFIGAFVTVTQMRQLELKEAQTII